MAAAAYGLEWSQALYASTPQAAAAAAAAARAAAAAMANNQTSFATGAYQNHQTPHMVFVPFASPHLYGPYGITQPQPQPQPQPQRFAAVRPHADAAGEPPAQRPRLESSTPSNMHPSPQSEAAAQHQARRDAGITAILNAGSPRLGAHEPSSAGPMRPMSPEDFGARLHDRHEHTLRQLEDLRRRYCQHQPAVPATQAPHASTTQSQQPPSDHAQLVQVLMTAQAQQRQFLRSIRARQRRDDQFRRLGVDLSSPAQHPEPSFQHVSATDRHLVDHFGHVLRAHRMSNAPLKQSLRPILWPTPSEEEEQSVEDKAKSVAATNPCQSKPKSPAATQPPLPTKPTTDHSDIPDSFRCAITLEPMADPVVALDGHTYERTAIEHWLKTQRKSPMSNLPMGTTLIPNLTLRSMMQDWLEQHHQKSSF